MKFPLPRLEFFKNNTIWAYGFALTAHEVTIKFSAGSIDEAKRWYNSLKTYSAVILLHISNDYKFDKLLSKNWHCRIRSAIDIETGMKCVVKSESKKKLKESKRQRLLV